MQVLSVVEKTDFKRYILKDSQQEYVAEQLFPGKSPRSRIIADIKRNIESIIEKRKDIVKHSAYIHYQKLEQIEGEYYLIRQGSEVYKSLYEYLKDNQPTLDEIVDWMVSIGQIALEIEKKGISWQGITMDALWLDENGELKLLDPDIANLLDKYRNINSIKPVEVYQAPEIFRNIPWDKQSLIYSTGIIMYYLITGELPFDTTDKSDLVHEILNNSPIEPIYLNPGISPALNDFIMESLVKDKDGRIKDWASFLERLVKIKESGIKATEVEEKEYRDRAEKVIRSTSRRKGLQSFWRKRWKAVTISISILLFVYIISITGGSDPYITGQTSARQVVEYFYQAVDEKNTVLLGESTIVDLKRLDSMVAETHVIEKMRFAYNYQNKEEEGLFGIKKLSIINISEEPQPVFEARYILYYNLSEQAEDVSGNKDQVMEKLEHYEVKMTDKLELGNVEGIWRIVHLEGSIEYVIQGKLMDLLK